MMYTGHESEWGHGFCQAPAAPRCLFGLGSASPSTRAARPAGNCWAKPRLKAQHSPIHKDYKGSKEVFLAISLTLRKMWRPLAHEICKWSVQLHFFRQGIRCHTSTLLPHRSLWHTDPRCGDVLLSHGPGYTPFTNLLRNIHHLQSQFYLKYWSPNMNFEQRYA